MGSLFGGNMPSVPPPPKPPEKSDAEVEEAARKEMLAQRMRRSGISTILSGIGGVQGSAPVAKKALLGQ